MEPKGKWIWLETGESPDSYAEFYDEFAYGDGKVELFISADSNYAVYLNGVFVNSGQYPDFPYYKVYDCLELTNFCRVGKNRLAVVVWHYGMSNMSYYPGRACLLYDLRVDGQTLIASDSATRSRVSPTYRQGRRHEITSQLGFDFHYDMTAEDSWMIEGDRGFSESCVLSQELALFPRPIPKVMIGEPIESRLVLSESGTRFLYDLGRESVGYLVLSAESDCTQEVLIAYGEHIADGGVRRIIGTRDFSVRMTLRPGENCYFNPFRRLGCRYLELFSSSPVRVDRLTVRPTDYPVAPSGKLPKDSLRRRIYEVCARTLSLCMHDHYEDTPWREQGLYAMDSRNQILCGYYAFGERAFARASLSLMSRDRRPDGLLSICVPSTHKYAIPSFTLHYFTEVYEYLTYTGDLSLGEEVYPKLQSLMEVYLSRVDEEGNIPLWMGDGFWNFYEWSPELDGNMKKRVEGRREAAQSCLLVIALRRMSAISRMLGKKDEYLPYVDRILGAIRRDFYDVESGLYCNTDLERDKSELVNSLAILCGAAEGEQREKIARLLASRENGMTPISLSMLCFKLDALLACDRDGYRAYVLEDLDRRYARMLDQGATSVWETEEGESDFDGAGSLCHGWSTMPIYYYSTLLDASEME
ncbi:MAG: hypothetical protein IJY47_02315 [Clostridia bacterium]|nr:hypothetical protein [Clostridia bacterium]